MELFGQINELMQKIAVNDYLTLKEEANKLIDRYNNIPGNAKANLVPSFQKY